MRRPIFPWRLTGPALVFQWTTLPREHLCALVLQTSTCETVDSFGSIPAPAYDLRCDLPSACTGRRRENTTMLRYARIHLFYALLKPFSSWTRKKRMALFLNVMTPETGMRILDLGGQPQIWDYVQPCLHITCVNLPGVATRGHQTHHRVTYIEADACDLRDQVKPGDFDLVFSNSVIEHVGGEDKRAQFASEVLRLCSRYWIQTPSKWFPIEAHCGMPLWWLYPKVLRAHLIRRWQAKLPAWTDMVANTAVVGATELRRILPGCRIRYERVFGLPKSIVAYSRGRPDAKARGTNDNFGMAARAQSAGFEAQG